MLWAEPLSPRDEILAPGRPGAPFCRSSLRMGHLPDDTQGKAPHFQAHQLRLWEAARENRQLPDQQWQWGRGYGGSQENLTWGWADRLLDSTSRPTGRAANAPQSHGTPRVTHSQAATGAGPPSRELPLLGTCPVLRPCSQGGCNVVSTFWALATCQGPLEALQKLPTCLCLPNP